jgi:hypothetical protein
MNIINPRQYATVTATTPACTVGSKYSMASTAQVLQVFEGHGWLPVGYNEKKAKVEHRVGKQAHAVLLAHRNPGMQDGATLPRILLKNSHDGTGSLQLLSGLYERICANGLIVGASAADVRITHRSITEEKLISGISQTVESLNRAIGLVERMRAVRLDREQQLQLASRTIEMLWDGEQYSLNPSALLYNWRKEQQEPTLWNTFNTIQERVIRGGVRRLRADGSRSTTRAITAIDSNVKANRTIWDVAEGALAVWA